jgi:DNA-binding XRE family transcriptional regulator
MRKADVSARNSGKVRKLTAIAAYGGNMTIGQRIRMYREKKGKTRAAMERETGISAATI